MFRQITYVRCSQTFLKKDWMRDPVKSVRRSYRDRVIVYFPFTLWLSYRDWSTGSVWLSPHSTV